MEDQFNEDIVIFDICNTLFDSNTTFDFFKFYFRDNKWYSIFISFSRSLVGKVTNSFIYRVFHKDIVRIYAIRFLEGSSKIELKEAAELFYQQILKNKKKRDIFYLMEKFRAEKAQIYLASATLDFLADTIKAKIGVLNSFSTKLLYKNDICTGKIDVDYHGKKDKLLLMAGIPLEKACVVTDNLSDRLLVKSSKAAYVITKSKNINRWNSLDNIKKMIIYE